MRVLYSFIVDGGEKFRLQTRTFIASLLGVGVAPTQILAQLTPAVDEATRDLIRGFGVFVRTIEPVLDKKYCNKIAQLKDIEDYPFDVCVLCDTDLAFVEDISDQFDDVAFRGKVVDVCRPNVELLNTLARTFGIGTQPRLITTLLDGQPTYSTNCNGGLYGVPRAFVRELHAKWYAIAEYLYERPQVLGRFRVNTDQIAFALAMLKLRHDNRELSIEYNFPLHLPGQLVKISFDVPKVLHYHMRLRRDGFVMLSGNPVADQAVQRVNQNLRQVFTGAGAFWKMPVAARREA